MVRMLRDGLLSIADEDKEPAHRQVEPAQTVVGPTKRSGVISHN